MDTTLLLLISLSGVMCILILSNNNLASGGGDSLVKIWEPVTGQLLMSLKGHHQEIVSNHIKYILAHPFFIIIVMLAT